jgi:hypothetical protein
MIFPIIWTTRAARAITPHRARTRIIHHTIALTYLQDEGALLLADLEGYFGTVGGLILSIRIDMSYRAVACPGNLVNIGSELAVLISESCNRFRSPIRMCQSDGDHLARANLVADRTFK